MTKKLYLLGLLMLMTVAVHAALFPDMKPVKLEVSELKPGLVKTTHHPLNDYRQLTVAAPTAEAQPGPKMDFEFFKSKTNPGVKPYTFWDDVTFVGVPIFLAGIAIKGDKATFRQNYKDVNHPNTRLLTNFKTSIDDYTQYFGPAMTVGLKLGGYEGRSDWPRLLASSALSYGVMAGFVNGIKYTAKEMRPDGSTANSWPSGHTATSFVGATILHKEYGLTRSPWFSVAGYSVATATGVMRILNNRHWISDVLSGAGIGILSTELGYFLGDLLFKGKGLLRNDLEGNFDNQSFFSISMGFGLDRQSLSFDVNDLEYSVDADDFGQGFGMDVKFHHASSVDAEGAYFFNKYVGIGGRLRVRTMTAKAFNNVAEQVRSDQQMLMKDIMSYVMANPDKVGKTVEEMSATVRGNLLGSQPLVEQEDISIESDHLAEFSASAGLYFNIPLSKHFSLGTKFLVGRSMTQALDVDAHFSGYKKDMEFTVTKTHNGVQNMNITRLGTTVDQDGNPQKYDTTWDFITLSGNNTTTYGTGLSITYRYKSSFAWKVFMDYDYARKEFTMSYDPYRYIKLASPHAEQLFKAMGTDMEAYRFKQKKDMNYFTLGGSFMITF